MNKALGLLSLILLIALLWWWGVSFLQVSSYFLPSLPSVLTSAFLNHTNLLIASAYTLGEAIIGLLLASILAITLASVCYFIPFISALLQPLTILSQALPLMVLAPLIVLWLGFDWSAKLTIVVLSLFFPIFIATLNGFRHIPKLWLELGYTFQATPLRLFFYMILPGSFSYIASGIKIAAAWAMLSAIVAEWVGGNQGLGFLMQNALHRLDSAFLFATLFLLIFISLGFYAVLSYCFDKLFQQS